MDIGDTGPNSVGAHPITRTGKLKDYRDEKGRFIDGNRANLLHGFKARDVIEEYKVTVPAVAGRGELAEVLGGAYEFGAYMLEQLREARQPELSDLIGKYIRSLARLADVQAKLLAGTLPIGRYEGLSDEERDRLKERLAYLISRGASQLRYVSSYVHQNGFRDAKGKVAWWVGRGILSLIGSLRLTIARWGSVLAYEEQCRLGTGIEFIDIYLETLRDNHD